MKPEIKILNREKERIEYQISCLKNRIIKIDNDILFVNKNNKTTEEKELEIKNLLSYSMEYHSKNLWREAFNRVKQYFPNLKEIFGINIEQQFTPDEIKKRQMNDNES